jgi:hypothetical protein
MNKKHVLLIIGLLLVAFDSNAQKPHYIKTNEYEGVVNTKPTSSDAGKGATQIYIPTDREIALMEKKITISIGKLDKEYIKHHYANKSCDIEKNLPKYKRYYTGLCFRGENIIITTFYRYLPKNWKITMPNVYGGGLCKNFVLKYNIKKDTLIGLFPGEL